MSGWMNHKQESKLPGEISITTDLQVIPPLWQKAIKKGTKESLDEGEREDWKSWLKTQHSKMEIMASGPITSGQIDGEKQKQWQILFSWAPESLQTVTATVKLRHLLFGRKAITNWDNILKSRDITLPAKVHIIKAMIFPVVMNRYKSWAIKKAEYRKTWCFQIVVLEETLESPLDNKEIKPINPKGNQPWIIVRRTEAEDEAPIFWPVDGKS